MTACRICGKAMEKLPGLPWKLRRRRPADGRPPRSGGERAPLEIPLDALEQGGALGPDRGAMLQPLPHIIAAGSAGANEIGGRVGAAAGAGVLGASIGAGGRFRCRLLRSNRDRAGARRRGNPRACTVKCAKNKDGVRQLLAELKTSHMRFFTIRFPKSCIATHDKCQPSRCVFHRGTPIDVPGCLRRWSGGFGRHQTGYILEGVDGKCYAPPARSVLRYRTEPHHKRAQRG